MAHPKYGCLHPNPKTVEYGATEDVVWHHDGANVCYLDSSGFVSQAITTTGTVFGYALIPKGMGAGSATASWKSSATAGADRLAVIPVDEGYEFLLPSDGTPTAAQAGNACDIINASATDTTASLVDIGTSTNDIFIIQGRGIDWVDSAATTDVVVKFNPAERQAD